MPNFTQGGVELLAKNFGKFNRDMDAADKVVAEVESPAAGVLKEILVQEGETVKVNAPLALIE